MKEIIVFLNGSFVPSSKANISVFDRGLLYGDGLFETMRSYRGKVFALDEHLQRMSRSAEFIRMHFSNNTARWHRIINKLLIYNKLDDKDSYIRITITRGVDYSRLTPSGHNLRPTEIVVVKPIPQRIKKNQVSGIKAVTLTFFKSSSVLSNIKSLNFLDNVIGAMMAKDMDTQEAIFISPEGTVLEGTVSNIFIIKNGRVKTPPLSSKILPGITRQTVIDIANKIGLEVAETPIRKIDLLKSDEAFVTNSIIEVTPLIIVDGGNIGGGRHGEITQKILKGYKDIIRRKEG
ncbi:MAG TPA: branched-chain amino acid aminotransferase [Deltaproteobacteria bacterium]|nr:branched-chain amino acid aminotransferase [Deltaproteobacteria bacterium]